MEGGAGLEKVFRQEVWRRGGSQPHRGVCAAARAPARECEPRPVNVSLRGEVCARQHRWMTLDTHLCLTVGVCVRAASVWKCS